MVPSETVTDTHLVTLALRVLTLFELWVRRGQEQSGEKLQGLYPGLPKRTTDRPTGKRLLAAGEGMAPATGGVHAQAYWAAWIAHER